MTANDDAKESIIKTIRKSKLNERRINKINKINKESKESNESKEQTKYKAELQASIYRDAYAQGISLSVEGIKAELNGLKKRKPRLPRIGEEW